MTKIVKVLGYGPSGMKVLIEEERTFASDTFSKDEIPSMLNSVEEPTAAQLVALTDSYLALGDKEKAAQAAKTAITLSGGDRVPLLTLTVILLRADMLQLAKKAFVAIDEGLLSKIDDFTKDERAEKPAKRESAGVIVDTLKKVFGSK